MFFISNSADEKTEKHYVFDEYENAQHSILSSQLKDAFQQRHQ